MQLMSQDDGDMLGISLGYFGFVLGIFLRIFWDIFKISLGYLWDIFGISLGYFWDIFGIFFEYLRDIFGISFVGAYLRSSSGHFSLWITTTVELLESPCLFISPSHNFIFLA